MKQPNFMCIGAPKSGTTTLYDILKQHPDVYVPSFKEPHFFDKEESYKKGMEWYLNQYFAQVQQEKAIGEFTPGYLIDDYAPARILNDCSNIEMKFIVILRNPIDRAFSQYLHNKRDLMEDLSFINALDAEEKRIKMYKDKNDLLYKKYSYIRNSLYFERLENWLKYFDKAQFKIIIFEEELLKDKENLLSEIFDFLNISQYDLNLNIKSNVASKTRFIFFKKLIISKTFVHVLVKLLFPYKLRIKLKNYLMSLTNKVGVSEKIDEDAHKEMLKEYFLDDIKKLEKLISRDLTVWKTT